MVKERYNRQGLIKDWDQDKLTNSKVTLVGSNFLSDLILVDLLSMGFGNINRIGSSETFEFEKINPEVYLEQKEEELSTSEQAEILVEDSNAVIDTSNDWQSKFFSSIASENKKIPYFACISTKTGLLLAKDLSGEQLINSQYNYLGERQGIANSIICSAMVSDELRKKIMPLEDDIDMENLKYETVHESKTLEKKILQIGAGAIGTFSAIGLALLGADLNIVDFDSIEESNLNRQFLFYDSVGLNKAEVLEKRLKKFSKNINSFNGKIDSQFNPSGFDYIFSCVDNDEARYYMNKASKKYNVPLINGGSSLTAGIAMPYYPNKTACLDCQTGFKLSEGLEKQKEKRQAGDCFNPSLIISNQITAGLMLNSLSKSINRNYEKSNYISGGGIFDQKVDENCFSQCIT
ncbi:MAG: ThiF family adenylyltransferase [Candidatus Pacearchaeota archaeon]